MATIDQKSGVFAGLAAEEIPAAGSLALGKPKNFVAMQWGDGTPQPIPGIVDIYTEELVIPGPDLVKEFTLGTDRNILQCVPLATYTHTEGASYRTCQESEWGIRLWDDNGTPKATFTRSALPSADEDTIVVLTLLEFPPEVTVTHYDVGTAPMTYDTDGPGPNGSYHYNHTISAIDRNHTFILGTSSSWDYSNAAYVPHGGSATYELLDNTTAQIRIAYGGQSTVLENLYFYIVEDTTGGEIFSVSRAGDWLWDETYTDFDLTVPAHDASKTLVIGSLFSGTVYSSYPNNTVPSRRAHSCERINDTTIRVMRDDPFEYSRGGRVTMQLVTFVSGVKVSHYVTQVTDTEIIHTANISAIADPDESSIVHYYGAGSTCGTTDFAGIGCYPHQMAFRMKFATLDTVTLTRSEDIDARTNSRVGFQVIERI